MIDLQQERDGATKSWESVNYKRKMLEPIFYYLKNISTEEHVYKPLSNIRQHLFQGEGKRWYGLKPICIVKWAKGNKRR